MKKFLISLLTLVMLLCCSMAVACAGSGDDGNNNGADDGGQNPPTVSYYDDVLSSGLGGIAFDGSFSDMSWDNRSAMQQTTGEITAKIRSTNINAGWVFGVELSGANDYLSESNLDNSAKIIVKISTPSNVEFVDGITMVVLADGRTRLEVNGEKVLSEKRRAFVKKTNGKIIYEFLIPQELIAFGGDGISADLFCVNPVNESCQSSQTVNFAVNKNYDKDKPYTWNCFVKNKGYYDISANSDDLILNTYDGDIVYSGDIVCYYGVNSKKFAIKDFTDSENKISLTLKAKNLTDNFSAGLVYDGIGNFGVKKQGNGFVFDGLGENTALTTAQQTALLSDDGLTIALSYIDGVFSGYAVSDGQTALIKDKQVSGNIANVFVYVDAPCLILDLLTGENSVRVITDTPLAKITYKGSCLSGSFTVTVTLDASATFTSFTLNGEKINVSNGKVFSKTYQNYGSFLITFSGEVEMTDANILVVENIGSKEGGAIKNTQVTVKGDGLSYSATTDDNGKIYLQNIPTGAYEIIVDGYSCSRIVVKTDAEVKAVLNYNIFDTYDKNAWSVSNDLTTIYSLNNSSSDLYLKDVDENFVLTMTMRSLVPTSQSLNKITDEKQRTNTGLRFYHGDTFFTMNLLVWTQSDSAINSFCIKTQTSLDMSVSLTEQDFIDYNNQGVKLMIAKRGLVISVYIIRGEVSEFLYEVTAPQTITKISFNKWNYPNVMIEDFGYEKSLIKGVKNNITVTPSSVDNTVRGSANADERQIYEGLKVTFTPDSGYGVASVTVNGVQYVNLVENNTLYLPAFRDVVANVVVQFEKIVDLEISVTKNGNPLKSVSVELTCLKYDTITYSMITSSTNGTCRLQKAFVLGAYSADIYGAGAYTVYVDANVVATGKLQLHADTPDYNSSSSWYYDDNGYLIMDASIGGINPLEFNTAEPITYAEVVVFNPLSVVGAPATEKSLQTIGLGDKNGDMTTHWGLVYNKDGNIYLRFVNNEYGWQQIPLTSKQTTALNGDGLKIAVLITEQFVYGLVDDGDGNLVVCRKVANPTGARRAYRVNSIRTDITYGKYLNLKTRNYFEIPAQVESSVNGSVQVTKASYGKIEAIVQANDGYAVANITVNGVNAMAYLKNGVLSYPCTLESATIAVNYQRVYTLSGTLTGDNGNNTFKVYKGTVITLTGSNGSYTTIVGDNGYYSFDGVVAGDYILAHGQVKHSISVTTDKTNADYTIHYTISADKYALTYTEQLPTNYDADKYYYNGLRNRDCPDPAVIEITDTRSEYYGQFFLYGTTGMGKKGFATFKSSDLINWEYVSLAFPIYDGWEEGELWAPEVIYDAEVDRAKYGLGEGKGVYYMFYSAGSKVAGLGYVCSLGLGVSVSPAGPFVRYVGTDSLGRTIDRFTPWMDGVTVNNKIQSEYGVYGGHNIDPTPFIDPETGDRYLFMTAVKACKMIDGDWSQMDYDSFKLIVRKENETIDTSSKEFVTATNEGPQVVYRDGKYHLSISVNGYQDKSYSVIQLVADDVMGPYRKLSTAEGGVLLSSVYGDTPSHALGNEQNSIDNLSGPGHHYLIQINGQMYIVYHRHVYTQTQDGLNYQYPVADGKYKPRYVTVDKVEWTKNANGLEVMRMAPTTSVQSKFYGIGSDYDNIIGDATVTATSGQNIKYLTDGLILAYDMDKAYFGEFTATKSVTITVSFDTYRTVAGLMVYNSKYYDSMFTSIARVEFDSVKDGVFSTAYAENISYSDAYYDSVKRLSYPGGASVMDFDDLLVKEIRITIELSQGNTKLALSEISVLGKPND